MNKIRLSFLFAVFFISGSILFGQITTNDIQKLRGTSNAILDLAIIDIPDKIAFIMLNPEYPVTQGDTYQISYTYNLNEATIPFFIEEDGMTNLHIFGNLDTNNLTYRELKASIITMVSKAYPGSLPILNITSTGFFPVEINGEIKIPLTSRAWGFSRLSDIVTGKLTKYSSLRNIELSHADGTTEEYDLFAASLKIDSDKNPVIKPGDSITIKRYDREVYISGEVRRPGAFQLLENESLQDLVENYSNGLTKLADSSRIYILRINTINGSTETVYLDSLDGDYNKIRLEDMDMVVVPAKLDNMPLVFFEGALGMNVGSSNPNSAKIPWPITANQRISTALNNLPGGSITPVSDLQRSFIIRKGEENHIPVDLNKIVYEHDYSIDPLLKEGDRIIIPMKLYTVYVGGSVNNSSAFPYIPGKTFLEYIQMAGGFDPDEHIGSSVTIIDRDGNQHNKDRIIQPEDRIFAPRNSPEYFFNVKLGTYVGTTAALVALVISFFTLQAYLSN
jgi:polysaccharide biosynthesis/export protein